ncbi:YeeE/YedE family protein, partial [Rhizobium ruizarguesonis]
MNRNIYQFAAALASGIIFGLGLSLSGMLNPVRV